MWFAEISPQDSDFLLIGACYTSDSLISIFMVELINALAIANAECQDSGHVAGLLIRFVLTQNFE